MAIYKLGRGFELWTIVNKSSEWPERDLNSRPPDYKSGALTTQPHLSVTLLAVTPPSVCTYRFNTMSNSHDQLSFLSHLIDEFHGNLSAVQATRKHPSSCV